MRIEQRDIHRAIDVNASTDAVWSEVTRLDISAFPHPTYLSILGIPKPLRAEILRHGKGGARDDKIFKVAARATARLRKSSARECNQLHTRLHRSNRPRNARRQNSHDFR